MIYESKGTWFDPELQARRDRILPPIQIKVYFREPKTDDFYKKLLDVHAKYDKRLWSPAVATTAAQEYHQTVTNLLDWYRATAERSR